MVDGGMRPDDATKALRPPVFFRRVAGFAKAVAHWSSPALAGVIGGLSEAERECKRTGAPDVLVCRNAILAIARRAAR